MIDDIIFAIAKANPYTINEVKELYLKCNSFDKTISVINECRTKGLDIDTVIQTVNIIE